jgi:hypothetical protein
MNLEDLKEKNEPEFTKKTASKKFFFQTLSYFIAVFVAFFVILFLLVLSLESMENKDKKLADFVCPSAENQTKEWLEKSLLPMATQKELEAWVNSFKLLPKYKIGGENLEPKHVLFYGPPGTGKSFAAKIFAENESAAYNFVNLEIEKYAGTNIIKRKKILKRAKKILNKQRENKPVVLIADELDSIGKKNSSHPITSKEVNNFLNLIDEIEQEKLNIIVIGITNYPDQLEEATVRAGRLGRSIEFFYLNEEEIKVLVKSLEEEKKEVTKGQFKSTSNKEGWESSSAKNNKHFIEWGEDYWKKIEDITLKINEKSKNQGQGGITFINVKTALDISIVKSLKPDTLKIIPETDKYEAELERVIKIKKEKKESRTDNRGGEIRVENSELKEIIMKFILDELRGAFGSNEQ